MLIKYDETGEILTSWKYDEKNKLFDIFTNAKEKAAEYSPVLTLDTEYNPQNFKLVILYNKRRDCTENSIYPVYVKKQRIGWIFPIQALLSKSHDYAENRFFLKYACVALLNDCEKKNSKNIAENLYQVRCLLVHKLYILTDSRKVILQKINHLFLDALIDIVLTFDASQDNVPLF